MIFGRNTESLLTREGFGRKTTPLFDARLGPSFIWGKEAFGVVEERQTNAKEGLKCFSSKKGVSAS